MGSARDHIVGKKLAAKEQNTSPQDKESDNSPLSRLSVGGKKQPEVDPNAENNKSTSFGFKGFVSKLKSITGGRNASAQRSEGIVTVPEGTNTPATTQ